LLCEDFEAGEPTPALWGVTPFGFSIDAGAHSGTHGLKITAPTDALSSKQNSLPNPLHVSFWGRLDDSTVSGGTIVASVVKSSVAPGGFVPVGFRVGGTDADTWRIGGNALASSPYVYSAKSIWLCYDLIFSTTGQLQANVLDSGYSSIGIQSVSAASKLGDGAQLTTISFGWWNTGADFLHEAPGTIWIDDILVSTNLQASGSACTR